MNTSVVVPTYNRKEQLSLVIDHLLASNVEGFDAVEIIVVDDGSPDSAEGIVKSKNAAAPFELRYIRQENAGPAEARNHGLREARNKIVVFVDDDVLLLPDALRRHVDAHRRYPKSVIFGPYPYAVPAVQNAEYRFLQNLVVEGLDTFSAQGEFARVDTVASGNLSIEKDQFDDGLYEVGLVVPVAEEYALIDTLYRKGIPTYLGRDIGAWHLQPPTIGDCCKQNYKYGLGIAEVAIKRPNVLELEQLRRQYEHNLGVSPSDGIALALKKITRNLLGRPPLRQMMLAGVRLISRTGLPDSILFHAFSSAIGVYTAAGVRDGREMFAAKE